jgi:hypothetical protein
MHRFKIYTGPTLVHAVGDHLTATEWCFGLTKGTEHVYLDTDLDYFGVMRLLKAFCSGWKASDIGVVF